jgi:tetratricopeptide (TPR) repeat protein
VFDLIAPRGGRLVRDPAKATLVVISHSLARYSEDLLPLARLPHAVSENAFRRVLNLTPPLTVGQRPFGPGQMCGVSGLTEAQLNCLSLFDVLEPAEGLYSYVDLRIARTAAKLLTSGLTVQRIIEAAHELVANGFSLASTELAESEWGALHMRFGERQARMNGQYTLDLDHDTLSFDEVFALADEAEVEGRLKDAERWYLRAVRMTSAEPTAHFNFANVLAAQGKVAAALAHYQRALSSDPQFAEAWFNIGCLQEQQGRWREAETSYAQAVAVQPAYADAAYNRARLLTELEHYAVALPLWERFMSDYPDDEQVHVARKQALICRLALRS